MKSDGAYRIRIAPRISSSAFTHNGRMGNLPEFASPGGGGC